MPDGAQEPTIERDHRRRPAHPPSTATRQPPPTDHAAPGRVRAYDPLAECRGVGRADEELPRSPRRRLLGGANPIRWRCWACC